MVKPSHLLALPREGDIGEWLMGQPWGRVLYSLERFGSVLGKPVVVLGQEVRSWIMGETAHRLGPMLQAPTRG